MLFSALENNNFCIFTGGPGGGKTTVLNLLSNIGYMTIKETGREIIQNQMKTNGSAVPWIDTKRYAHLMYLYSLIDFEENIHLEKPCFFDRGIIDVLGYCRLINIPISAELKEAASKYHYYKKVFLFPFWDKIYTNDTERKQNKEEAKRTCDVMKNTYEEFGYQIVTVPYLKPEERAQWIIEELNVNSETATIK